MTGGLENDFRFRCKKEKMEYQRGAFGLKIVPEVSRTE